MSEQSNLRALLTVSGCAGVLGLLAGLCSLLALVVTIGEAWYEHKTQGWSRTSAIIEQCNVDLHYFNGPTDDDPTWILECRIRFRAGTDDIRTKIHSGHRSNPSQGYPDLMDRWVEAHPNGSTIEVRFDPANPKAAMPDRDFMPNGGPRTRYNLRFLLVLVCLCVVLLTIARLFRRASPAAS